MYKLGPVHQGVVERGSKTGSDSYMLWPAKVGAFTVVMGRHYRNSDTSDLPFSYLIEHEDESVLAPGVNLRSVGTVRDARKWPQRDRRKDPEEARPHQLQAAEPLHHPEDDQRPGPAAQAQGDRRTDLRLLHLPERQDPQPRPGAGHRAVSSSASTSSSATACSSGWRASVSRTCRNCGPPCGRRLQVGPGQVDRPGRHVRAGRDRAATARRHREPARSARWTT